MEKKEDMQLAIDAMKQFLKATSHIDSNGNMWPAVWSGMCNMQNIAMETIKFVED